MLRSKRMFKVVAAAALSGALAGVLPQLLGSGDAPTLEDVTSVASPCFLEEGFDIEGRLEFVIETEPASLLYRPVVETDPDTYSAPMAMRSLDGEASRARREAVIERCYTATRRELGIPALGRQAQPRSLNAAASERVLRCIDSSGISDEIESIELFEGKGSIPEVEAVLSDMTVDEMEEAMSSIRRCTAPVAE